MNTEIYTTAYLKDTKGHPEDFSDRQNYSSAERYSAAKVPRRVVPINIDAQTQLSRKIPNLGVPNFQYSDELNDWMVDCLQYDPLARPNVEDLVLNMGEVAREMLKQMGGAASMVDMEVTF